MSIAEVLGRPFVQRSWFERQFARTADGKLHFHESPRRPVRAASDAERERYILLAMAHWATVMGWTQMTALPFVAVLLLPLPPSLLLIGLAIDAAAVWAILQLAPDVRATRREVRVMIEHWPIVEEASTERHFRHMWSGRSLAMSRPKERRTLVASGLFFAVGGAFLLVIGQPLGWAGVIMGSAGLLFFAVLALR